MPARLTSLTLHRETVQLVVLTCVAAMTFGVTASFAAWQRRNERDDAAEWFERASHARDTGQIELATADLRRAVSLRPRETAYVLALSAALSELGQFDAATRALMRLRLDTPDEPTVNRAIARIAARRRDVTAAVRYYHNALYGPWQSAEGPRQIRLELIRFLLDNGEARRAVSELIAATTDLPDTVDAHRELGQLFAAAGEPARALELFRSALKVSPTDAAAIEGAVATSFALGDYDRAASYRLPPGASATTREQLQLAALVVAIDPLVARLGINARRRRLEGLLSHAARRATTCSAADDAPVRPSAPTERGTPLERNHLDIDIISTRLEHLLRDITTMDAQCPPTLLDRAIVLIARRHNINVS